MNDSQNEAVEGFKDKGARRELKRNPREAVKNQTEDLTGRAQPQHPIQFNNNDTNNNSGNNGSGAIGNGKIFMIGVGVGVAVLICGMMIFGGGKEKTPTSPVSSTNSVNKIQTPASSPAPPTRNASYNAKMHYNNMMKIEARLKNMADSINSGANKSVMLRTGSVLFDDIASIRNQANREPDYSLREFAVRMHEIQMRRVNCMMRGLRGETAAYAEGGRYYDEFYERLNRFKADNNIW